MPEEKKIKINLRNINTFFVRILKFCNKNAFPPIKNVLRFTNSGNSEKVTKTLGEEWLDKTKVISCQ